MPWTLPVNTDHPVEPLPAEGVAAIHDGAMRILEQIGIQFMNLEAVEILREAGCAVSAEVGHGGHHFGTSHTMERYETAFYAPFLSDWSNYENWHDRGAQLTVDRARDTWNKILAEFEPPPLDAAIAEELDAFVKRRKSDGGAPTDF